MRSRVPTGWLELCVPDAEIRPRLRQWKAPARHHARGYEKLFLGHVLETHEGCDFDFLRGAVHEHAATPLKRCLNPAL
jgi:dihydroxy-acid dehydratase